MIITNTYRLQSIEDRRKRQKELHRMCILLLKSFENGSYIG